MYHQISLKEKINKYTNIHSQIKIPKIKIFNLEGTVEKKKVNETEYVNDIHIKTIKDANLNDLDQLRFTCFFKQL